MGFPVFGKIEASSGGCAGDSPAASAKTASCGI